MLNTKRLILRQWEQDDFIPFEQLCADTDVMEFFPKPLTPEESRDLGSRIRSLIQERDWGFWAVEIPDQEKFIGFVGLHTPNENLPFSPCVEIGWRLTKTYWGQGYATEAAKEALRYAFIELDVNEVVSFTSLVNRRSQAVMEKIGMSNTGQNFMHPDIEAGHILCEHVLYKIKKQDWQNTL
ncbi:GNAT family N-acetyltransferase [Aestuariirhabdus sp. Z084]|uniref:GNAT family N-acetyltransferase n=1 Tax=Aestuariirhabdus haliotis TaxID=2918751 RepID=UPI00201B3E5D|nr:GNAT family N-acetyltransferase [Aestuariirhabdus haliotis]MCL6417696.1 GNAT family N-acetyltransferase [Aestuariirhabdus haliotis]MCL6421647.1 GNAT family N-acetyltransferase [Aestuariirhabdus haliotis]